MMASPSSRTLVDALLDAMVALGAAASVIEQGPVLVALDFPCAGRATPKASCDMDRALSAHGALAITGYRDALEGQAASLSDWVGGQARVLVDNEVSLRLTAGVFQNEEGLTGIFQLSSTKGRTTIRGKNPGFGVQLAGFFDGFQRLESGTRRFQNQAHPAPSPIVRAGNLVSAIAYQALLSQKRAADPTDAWCELFAPGVHAAEVARLLEVPHV
jgi:hypothetical protein